MSFSREPSFTHGTEPRTAVVLVNLGTPDKPTRGAVRRYLRQFLSDRRVVEIPRVVWWFILNLIILPFRSGKSAKKYNLIWTKEGSPLKVHTQKQAQLLRKLLTSRGHDVEVAMAMRYGSPSIPEVLDKLKAENCTRIAIVPAYPQYAGSTTGSMADAVFAHYRGMRNLPELRIVRGYADHEAYIAALAASVREHWEANGRAQKLVMSFHGVPRRTLTLGDPYHCECYKTARLLAQALRIGADDYVVTFQSRFGKAEWLQPYTQPTLEQLARDGVRSVDVMCPGFTSDCLETLEEIDMECKRAFEAAGGQQFNYIPCLNESKEWIAALGEITEGHLVGWPTVRLGLDKDEALTDLATGRERAIALGALQ